MKSEFEELKDLYRAEERHYNTVVKDIKGYAKKVAEHFDGSSVIFHIYSRVDKQHVEKSELKSIEKVFSAIKRPISRENLVNMDDIVGITIVVYYNSQIDEVLDKLDEQLSYKFSPVGKRKIHSKTYIATHAVYQSKTIETKGLRCEVQCKTMLHDAWSAKMHDLTYKPQGSLDPKIKDVIEAVSTILEGVEKQSEFILDMVTSRQASARRSMDLCLEAMLIGFRNSLEEWREENLPPQVSKLWGRLYSARDYLKVCPTEDPDFAAICNEIDELCNDEGLIRYAWPLAAEISSLRKDRVSVRFLQNQIHKLDSKLIGWIGEGKFSERELVAIPLSFYASGDFDEALRFADKLIEGHDRYNIPPRRVNITKFNKATWIAERELLRHSKPEDLSILHAEAVELLKAVSGEDYADLNSCILDTEGLIKIVFGNDPETVRKGIEECDQADQNEMLIQHKAISNERHVSNAYREWHVQYGWRKYFDLIQFKQA